MTDPFSDGGRQRAREASGVRRPFCFLTHRSDQLARAGTGLEGRKSAVRPYTGELRPIGN